MEKKCEDAELLNAGFQQEDIEEKIMQQKDEEPHEDTGSKRQKKMKKKGARNPSRPKRRGSGVSTTSTESSPKPLNVTPSKTKRKPPAAMAPRRSSGRYETTPKSNVGGK